MEKDTLKIEKLNEIISEQLDPELANLKYLFQRSIGKLNTDLDSLRFEYLNQQLILHRLHKEKDRISLELMEAKDLIALNQQINLEKDKKIRYLFLISGSSILLFILVVLVLFILLMNRQEIKVDQKIDELKVFTQSQIRTNRMKEIIGKKKLRKKK
jgi:hypothetical protein